MVLNNFGKTLGNFFYQSSTQLFYPLSFNQVTDELVNFISGKKKKTAKKTVGIEHHTVDNNKGRFVLPH